MSTQAATQVSRRIGLAVALGLTLWAVWQVNQPTVATGPVEPRTASAKRATSATGTTSTTSTTSTKAAKTPSALPDRSTWPLVWSASAASAASSASAAFDVSIIDIFSVTPPPPAPRQLAPAAPVVIVPVFAFRYIGRLDDGDNHHAFLADASDTVTVVRQGQTLAGDWTLIAMNATQLVFQHPSGQQHTLPIGPPL